MKRQPIASAAVFYSIVFLMVESHRGLAETVGKRKSVTDDIFPVSVLYWDADKEVAC